MVKPNEIPLRVRQNFKKLGWPVIQRYSDNEAMFQCDNCGIAAGLRMIEGLGTCCLRCYANRLVCKRKGCRKRTVLANHGGRCRDCMMGPD
jgi:hypothetical protein